MCLLTHGWLAVGYYMAPVSKIKGVHRPKICGSAACCAGWLRLPAPQPYHPTSSSARRRLSLRRAEDERKGAIGAGRAEPFRTAEGEAPSEFQGCPVFWTVVILFRPSGPATEGSVSPPAKPRIFFGVRWPQPPPSCSSRYQGAEDRERNQGGSGCSRNPKRQLRLPQSKSAFAQHQRMERSFPRA